MKPFLITSIIVFTSRLLFGQIVCTSPNLALWESKQFVQDSSSTPQRILKAGKRFLGTPYEARTLEKEKEEKLVVYLTGLDCTTFVENSLAMALISSQPTPSFDAYTHALQRIRYRNGQVNAYPSRLHYFTDWLYDNQQKGLLEEITQQIGGKPYVKKINFMSAHRASYPQLANDAYWQEISRHEASINERPHHYIPKAEVASIETKLQDGDIIAITTGIAGLDVVHVGFAVRQNGRIHLMHASTDEKKVVISQQPLAHYLAAHKSQTGIMVARVK